MKRARLIRHLERHDCRLLREGGRHSIYINSSNGQTAPVPRHRETDEMLVLKICKEPEIEPPSER